MVRTSEAFDRNRTHSAMHAPICPAPPIASTGSSTVRPVWSIGVMWLGLSPWCIPVTTSGRKRPPSTKPAKAPPFVSSQVAAVPIATETTPATDIRIPSVIDPATSTVTVGTTMSAMMSGVTRRMNRST